MGGEGIERHVRDNPELGEAGLRARVARWARASGFCRPLPPSGSCAPAVSPGTGPLPARPRRPVPAASSSSRSMERRSIRRHGGDGLTLPFQHEHRIDEIVDGHVCFRTRRRLKSCLRTRRTTAFGPGRVVAMNHSKSGSWKNAAEVAWYGPARPRALHHGKAATTWAMRQESGFVAFGPGLQIPRHQIGASVSIIRRPAGMQTCFRAAAGQYGARPQSQPVTLCVQPGKRQGTGPARRRCR